MPEQDTTYNGWANYETWAVGMYLDGNYDGEGTYRYVIDVVENAMWEGGENHRRSHVANALCDLVEEALPDLGPSLASDILGAAFANVDWYELADAWIINVSEQVTA